MKKYNVINKTNNKIVWSDIYRDEAIDIRNSMNKVHIKKERIKFNSGEKIFKIQLIKKG